MGVGIVEMAMIAWRVNSSTATDVKLAEPHSIKPYHSNGLPLPVTPFENVLQG